MFASRRSCSFYGWLGSGGLIDGKVCRKLCRIDESYAVIRHITASSCEEFEARLLSCAMHEDGENNDVKTAGQIVDAPEPTTQEQFVQVPKAISQALNFLCQLVESEFGSVPRSSQYLTVAASDARS